MLKEAGYSCLINITRGSRKKYADEFAAKDFEWLPGRADNQQVEVKQITDPEDPDSVLVLCRSAQRRLKEAAMISTAEQRFLTDLGRLQARIAKGKLKRVTIIERAIGALLKKHPKVARYYQLTHESGPLRVERHDGALDAALELCGDYVLKTDHRLDAAELWCLYMTLLRAEEGFSSLKIMCLNGHRGHGPESRWSESQKSKNREFRADLRPWTLRRFSISANRQAVAFIMREGIGSSGWRRGEAP